jgi:hypothetical protein
MTSAAVPVGNFTFDSCHNGPLFLQLRMKHFLPPLLRVELHLERIADLGHGGGGGGGRGVSCWMVMSATMLRLIIGQSE